MSGGGSSNDLVLNYHDAILYESDLRLLESPTSWWNDACLHFALTYLEHHQSRPHSPTHSIGMFAPSVVSFLMHQCTDEEEDVQDFCRGNQALLDSDVILIPVNDNYTSQHWTTPGGGTHWSLLVVKKETPVRSWWHFDSIPQSGNLISARAVATKLQQVLLRPASDASSAAPVEMESCLTPPQANGYDCAIHTWAAARAVMECRDDFSVPKITRAIQEWLGETNACRDVRGHLLSEAQRLARQYASGITF